MINRACAYFFSLWYCLFSNDIWESLLMASSQAYYRKMSLFRLKKKLEFPISSGLGVSLADPFSQNLLRQFDSLINLRLAQNHQVITYRFLHVTHLHSARFLGLRVGHTCTTACVWGSRGNLRCWSLSSTLSEAQPLVHCIIPQARWLVSSQGVFCLHLLSHHQR